MSGPDAILIAGPTASGKSALALTLSAEYGGEIVNTDSMQIYPVLRILTARPDEKDMKTVPHHLYGQAALARPFSVARWAEQAAMTVQAIRGRGRIPIFVGGTGLYFRALEQGIAPVPDIAPDIREKVRTDLLALGSEEMHRQLARLDPAAAKRLRPSDGQRVARALEVVLSTGRSLDYFQSLPKRRLVDLGASVERHLLIPERSVLHDRINQRANEMLEGGALSEVEWLVALDLPREATALGAIGVSQLSALLRREITRQEALARLKAATRQYAKRQITWFRGQLGNEWPMPG